MLHLTPPDACVPQVDTGKAKKEASKAGSGKTGRQDKLSKYELPFALFQSSINPSPVNAGVMAIVVHRAAKKGKAKAVAKVGQKAPAEVVEKILDMRTLDGLEEVFVKFKGKPGQTHDEQSTLECIRGDLAKVNANYLSATVSARGGDVSQVYRFFKVAMWHFCREVLQTGRVAALTGGVG
jgi:hypothetical protein